MTEHTDPKRRSAVALSYKDKSDRAPRVVAKGYGEMAEAIIRHAKQSKLYVHNQPELVSLLMQLDLDEYIPATLYEVVAELLAWVYEVELENKE
ncbi:MAG TPA: EscU/YscU/HrcU family type III secretion system export apparatus switch protein [Paenalcaligenes sp.]|nr:EscU/YscU/HrcU family type III secretion system export apparatus switch protein [Paenalcaligenes sp.]